MRFLSLAAAVGIVMLASAPLAAQTPEPAPGTTETPGQTPAPAPSPGSAVAPETSPRYAFSRVDGGFLRFDSVTGQVALCSERSTGWACRAVPDDRAALDSEIARLQGEVTQLKSEIAALRAPAAPLRPPAELAPRAEGDAKSGGLRLPSDEDIQRARAAIQKLWRQFVDMVADFQKDVQRKG